MKNAVSAAPLLLVALLTLTVACADSEESTVPLGAELLEPFKMNMKNALVAGMEKGPVKAIDVCKIEAPAIAESLSVDGVVVGRASHRLRNPANAAPDWVAPILAAYLEEGNERAPELVTLDDNRLGYVEPIGMQPLCLTCHGETLAPDIAASIAEQYPQDQATGFEVGDLRGVFWVEYPAKK